MSVLFNWEKEEFEKLLSNCPSEPVTPYIFKYFKKEDILIEAGCGTGRFVCYLHKLGYRIKGIELNEAMVKLANDIYPEVDIAIADVCLLPYDNNSIDGILSLGVIEHIEEGMKIPLEEMHRVLKQNKYAIIIVPCFNIFRQIKFYAGYFYLRLYTGFVYRGIKKIFKAYFLNFYYKLIFFIKKSKLNSMKSNFSEKEISENLKPNEKINWKQSFKNIKKNKRYNIKKIGRRFQVLRWPLLGNFYEYRFTKSEFHHQLNKNGFTIVESIPVSLIDGIYHEFGTNFIKFKNNTFYPNYFGKKLNIILSKIPFFHNHMHLCIVKKRNLNI